MERGNALGGPINEVRRPSTGEGEVGSARFVTGIGRRWLHCDAGPEMGILLARLENAVVGGTGRVWGVSNARCGDCGERRRGRRYRRLHGGGSYYSGLTLRAVSRRSAKSVWMLTAVREDQIHAKLQKVAHWQACQWWLVCWALPVSRTNPKNSIDPCHSDYRGNS